MSPTWRSPVGIGSRSELGSLGVCVGQFFKKMGDSVRSLIATWDAAFGLQAGFGCISSSRARRLIGSAVVACLIALSPVVSADAAKVFLVTSSASPVPAPSASTGVQGDDGSDVYIGRGGVLIPARHWRGDSSGRRQAAECADCSWRMTTACTSLQFDTGSCPASHVGCPSGLIRVRVWLKHAVGPWVLVGYACVGGTPPVSRDVVEKAIHDLSLAALPPLIPSFQPASGALTGLPVVFWSGQNQVGLRQADLSVMGLDVRLDARPRWAWSWGDGGYLATRDPGGRYPRMTVSHTYVHAGRVHVTAMSRWSAQYSVEGLGPYPVPGTDLSQRAGLVIDVVPAHSVLTG